MAAAGQRAQLFGCLDAAGGLGEKNCPERQGLIGANNKVAGVINGDRAGFLARKKCGYIARQRKARTFLFSSLIDFGRNGFELDPRISK